MYLDSVDWHILYMKQQHKLKGPMQTSQKKKIHFLLYVVPRYVSNSAVGEKNE